MNKLKLLLCLIPLLIGCGKKTQTKYENVDYYYDTDEMVFHVYLEYENDELSWNVPYNKMTYYVLVQYDAKIKTLFYINNNDYILIDYRK